MEVKTYTQDRKLFSIGKMSGLLDSFLKNSNSLGNDSLKVDLNLFLEAASKQNVQFEFIRLNSFELDKKSHDISNAQNALIEAEYAIANSGLVVLDTSDADILLSVFLAETLHIIVPASKVLPSNEDLELVKGKVAVELGRGIASIHVRETNSQMDFSSKILRTMIYVIEDL
ncbi:LUD domain-containing protein [Ancylomarina longa]|uniref:LUD domain-containing protein n=1 Tax=Ancylomarina longa TaxID=2487017 RepID=A0A434AYI4_9BACT|nr:LUD domain-containing protein [Ancylomarina longa]RUT79544.1 hypothetical protein DLK05_02310 [Ancylomarina longa]